MFKKSEFLSTVLFETIRVFFLVLIVVVTWDLLVNAFCAADCQGFASTRTFFSNLHILLPLGILSNILIEAGKRLFKTNS